MKTDETYEIERLRIKFFKTDDIVLYKPCGYFRNKDIDVDVNCEEINLQGIEYIKKVFRSNVQTKTSPTYGKMFAVMANNKPFFKNNENIVLNLMLDLKIL